MKKGVERERGKWQRKTGKGRRRKLREVGKSDVRRKKREWRKEEKKSKCK